MLVLDDDAAAQANRSPPVRSRIPRDRDPHDRMAGPAAVLLLKHGQSRDRTLDGSSAHARAQQDRQGERGCEGGGGGARSTPAAVGGLGPHRPDRCATDRLDVVQGQRELHCSQRAVVRRRPPVRAPAAVCTLPRADVAPGVDDRWIRRREGRERAAGSCSHLDLRATPAFESHPSADTHEASDRAGLVVGRDAAVLPLMPDETRSRAATRVCAIAHAPEEQQHARRRVGIARDRRVVPPASVLVLARNERVGSPREHARLGSGEVEGGCDEA